jgi:entericidin B
MTGRNRESLPSAGRAVAGASTAVGWFQWRDVLTPDRRCTRNDGTADRRRSKIEGDNIMNSEMTDKGQGRLKKAAGALADDNKLTSESHCERRPRFRRWHAAFLVALALGPIALTACNTVQGAGKDLERGGQKVQDEAKEHKPY